MPYITRGVANSWGQCIRENKKPSFRTHKKQDNTGVLYIETDDFSKIPKLQPLIFTSRECSDYGRISKLCFGLKILKDPGMNSLTL